MHNKKRLLSAMLAIALVLPVLSGCQKESPDTTEPTGGSDTHVVYMGENEDIPCLELNGISYATADKVEWDYQEMGKDDKKRSYGKAEKIIVEPNAPMFNWYCGDGVYMNKYTRPDLFAYDKLIAAMETAGYEICYQGFINGDVVHTILTYEGNVYTVTNLLMANSIYVTASKERPLSPHLLPENDSTKLDAIPGAETTLTMLPTVNGGDNYVIQLKNGHFILFDGGSVYTLAKTLAYLEANTPEGQIPVVDAWFITHCHYDHVGWSAGFGDDERYMVGVMEVGEAAQRVRVNALYYNRPDEYIVDNTTYNWRTEDPTTSATGYRSKIPNEWMDRLYMGLENMLTEDGSKTPVYRPQTGQTYYFKDLTIEVPYCQEHITFGEYQMDINASSTWYLVRAEGKTFLDGGDTENVNIAHVVSMYSQDYDIFGGKLDIMSAFHHGHNIYSDYVDTFWAPKMFYTTAEMFQWAAQYTAANQTMLEKHNISYYCYGDGAYQFSFATGEVTKIS